MNVHFGIVGVVLLVAVAGLVLTSVPSGAHESRPLYVELIEESSGQFLARWRTPPSVPAVNSPSLEFPANCQALGPVRTLFFSSGEVKELSLTCSTSFGGDAIVVRYPLFNPAVSTLVRLEWLSGQSHTILAGPDEAEIVLPARESGSSVAREYLILGMEHILTGYDHLLFLLCLLFIARTTRRIIVTVTGFTIAHSITLALAALDVIRVAVPPVEAAIALSIVFLASEIARGRANSLTWRYPIVVSSSFGLLHGLGFAAVLGQIGLPQTEVPLALLFFNVGVEVGQIAFVLSVLVLFWVGGKGIRFAMSGKQFEQGAMARPASYAIGILGSYWMIDRLAGF